VTGRAPISQSCSSLVLPSVQRSGVAVFVGSRRQPIDYLADSKTFP